MEEICQIFLTKNSVFSYLSFEGCGSLIFKGKFCKVGRGDLPVIR